MYAIEYPTIALLGETLTVRYSFAAEVVLSRNGIEPKTLPQLLDANEPRRKEYMVRLFAACVAENYIDQTKPWECDLSKSPSADYWISRLSREDIAEVGRVVTAAMGKVAESLKLTRAATPIKS